LAICMPWTGGGWHSGSSPLLIAARQAHAVAVNKVPLTTPTPAFGERVVGAAAIALVASLVIQNAVLVWAGAPGFGDPIEKVLAFHAENRGAVAIAVGSEADEGSVEADPSRHG